MKTIFALVLLSLQISAFAAPNVVSTTNKIRVYNSQADALNIKTICKLVNEKEWDMGEKSALSCKNLENGVVEITGKNRFGELSILANATDKTVIEYNGDPHYKYQNNLNESMLIVLSFVNTGIRNTPFGIAENGYYRGDVYLRKGKTGMIRVGYYIQDFRK